MLCGGLPDPVNKFELRTILSVAGLFKEALNTGIIL